MSTRRFNLLSAYRLLPAAYLLAACGLPGCAETENRPSSADRALADPWNYGPKVGKPDTAAEKKDDSSFDREGFKRDLNNVFNP